MEEKYDIVAPISKATGLANSIMHIPAVAGAVCGRERQLLVALDAFHKRGLPSNV